jgi:hypothetical protein
MKLLAANKERENRNSAGKKNVGTGGVLGFLERQTGQSLHALTVAES